MAEQLNLNKFEYYTNRELSWLEFNYRILSEAKDKNLPLFERLKFLSITASNLDEFFMIRVASLKDLVHAKYTKPDISGMTPSKQLQAISKKTHELCTAQYNTYNRSFLPGLKKENLRIITNYEALTKAQSDYVDEYFMRDVYPVLTPMAVDSSRPFPLIKNKTLNIGALICTEEKEEEYDFATVQVPGVLPRFVKIPSDKKGETTIILLEQIIEKNIQKLFLNYKVMCAYPYRIMRNADLTIEEDEAEDLLVEIQKQLKMRQWGEVIRLEIEDGVDKRLLKMLKKEFNVSEDDIYKVSGPLDLTFLMKVYSMDGFDHLKNKKYKPQPVKGMNQDEDIFTQIRRHDIVMHHPYETFDPVVNFVRQAAKDPSVLAIKQTLYRVSSNSPIIAALAEAAENGKQVSVLVELKARFDEENNIVWAKMLEKAGCHVIYGLVGLKTHSKITLVVRRDEDGIRRYVHLGTGNYNDSTAKLYTDMGLMTCAKPIGEDATAVFNMLSGYSEPEAWNKLIVAPLWIRERFYEMIDREKQNALEGKPARIMAKMNSLCDQKIIERLYEASAAGVKIDLIVRGICCLKVGIPGISENITVRSLVGNFLEHSRIFYFHNNGFEEVYMGSADWMPRNLDKRVEIVFPVEDPVCKAEVIEILEVQLADNMKARLLKPDDSYERVDRRRSKIKLCAQDYFCEKAIAQAKENDEIKEKKRVFEPIQGV